MTIQLYTTALAAAFGACLGSFANVLIHRLPRNQSVVGGRSHCPHCHRQIAWYDNVPVLSWLVLRGRCRRCRGPIAWRYPVVEVVGAVLAAACVWLLGTTLDALRVFIFLELLFVIALIDWEHMVIPHTLTIAGMVAGLALAPFTRLGLGAAILGLVVGAGVVLALSEGYRLTRGQAGMGGGDVMLMGLVGAFLGPWGAAAVMGAGALLGTLYVLIRGAGRLDGTAKLPFGTFLAGGGALVLLWGPAIWQWYTGMFA